MKAVIFYTNGVVVDTAPANGSDFALQQLQDIVGGCIEVVDLGYAYMAVNENGKLDGLDLNVNATAILHASGYTDDYIAGDALVCDKSLVK